MRVDISKLGEIFVDSLYWKLESEINTKIHVDEFGIEYAHIDDVLAAIRYVLGMEE